MSASNVIWRLPNRGDIIISMPDVLNPLRHSTFYNNRARAPLESLPRCVNGTLAMHYYLAIYARVCAVCSLKVLKFLRYSNTP